MSKKLKGFSLAELLISLLVISIVLSAAIPTITKRTSQDREQIWKWSTDNNSAYFGLGSNQAVLIGTPTIPSGSLTTYMDDDLGGAQGRFEDPIFIKNPRFTTTGDKVSILKQSLQGHTTNMANSHISFYNIDSGAERNSANITYAGRIATDKHNLAFGRGTLLHLEDPTSSWFGENTAIGHYALMATTKGYQNVAVGEKSLSNNRKGFQNTAVGFLAANKLGRETDSDATKRANNRSVNGITINEINTNGSFSSENTAIGNASLSFNETGFGNTSIGSRSLEINYYGDDNTALGYSSLGLLEKGYGNTAVGSNACNAITEGNYNICIGNAVLSEKTKDNYSLSIGSTATPEDGATYTNNIRHSVPLITGHTQRVGNAKITASNVVAQNTSGNYDKELIVNSRHVKFKPFAGGDTAAFTFTSVPGNIYNSTNAGYGDGDNFITPNIGAEAYFNLRYNRPNSPTDVTDSVAMGFTAQPNLAVITSFNPTSIDLGTKKASYTNLLINELLITTPDGVATSIPVNDKIRSNKSKIGIISAVIDDSQAPDITINNKLNVSRQAVHTIDVDNFGTRIWGNNTDPREFEVNLTGVSGSPDIRISAKDQFVNFKVPTNGLFFYNSSGSGSHTALTAEGLTIGSGKDLYYEDAFNVGGTQFKSVRAAIQHAATIPQTPSDARLKNISGDNTAGLAEINKIEVKNYTYKKDEKKTPHVGVIAQQLQKIFPNSVTKGDDGYLRIRTEEIFYAMVNSIKELCAKLQDLTAKVVGLDKRITELEAQNKMLLEQNKAFEKRLEKLEKQAAK